ncbi:MAG: UDP-N-acetylglucosamine--N-acetylmuramyl-(pentapeptide) pyrophosphoryl-undecaprenol N-acetylglucosamine transferase [Gammaproteobacteria bacterium]|nr:MAG: UDP-N-acetylglucosamine--N-acetylmuramyl-(pentapeptide) pyrophosphoryl-undecaprenol N-acetylglucosamine transferase [Gammaproteobacteria bacterium]
MKRVLFTGGGTAGHVVPAFPIIEVLLARGVEVSYIGSNSGLEEGLLSDFPLTYRGISAGKLRRYFSFENIIDVWRVFLGIWQAARLLGQLRPEVVFSKGGFVSFPVVVAAWLRHIPVVIHESDFTAGLANRMSFPFCRTLCVNFANTKPVKFKGRMVHTGTPVRAALLEGNAVRGREFLGIDQTYPVLIVTGGSLGADALNEAVRDVLQELTEKFVLVHICGPGKKVECDRPNYRQFEYLTTQWGDVLAAADLVVSRAGANTLYELLVLRKANLLVPLSRRVSRGDQVENAEYARSLGFSRVIEEQALNGPNLVREVLALLADLDEVTERLGEFAVPDSVALILAALEEATSQARY